MATRLYEWLAGQPEARGLAEAALAQGAGAGAATLSQDHLPRSEALRHRAKASAPIASPSLAGSTRAGIAPRSGTRVKHALARSLWTSFARSPPATGPPFGCRLPGPLVSTRTRAATRSMAKRLTSWATCPEPPSAAPAICQDVHDWPKTASLPFLATNHGGLGAASAATRRRRTARQAVARTRYPRLPMTARQLLRAGIRAGVVSGRLSFAQADRHPGPRPDPPACPQPTIPAPLDGALSALLNRCVARTPVPAGSTGPVWEHRCGGISLRSAGRDATDAKPFYERCGTPHRRSE